MSDTITENPIVLSEDTAVACTLFIGFGAIIGGATASVQTIERFQYERFHWHRETSYPYIENSIYAVSCASRAIFATAVGCIAGGLTAATAPISVPLYFLYCYNNSKQDNN